MSKKQIWAIMLLMAVFTAGGVIGLVRDLHQVPENNDQPQKEGYLEWSTKPANDQFEQEIYGPMLDTGAKIKPVALATEYEPTTTTSYRQMTWLEVVEPTPEPTPEPVSNLLSWLADHDSETETFTISKKVQDGHLMVMLKNEVEEKFVFDTGEFLSGDTDTWEQVEETYTSQEVVDLVYVVYHEVSGDGTSEENREAQCSVVLNRVKHWWFPKTIRKVITQEYQYESANCVVNRWLKSQSDIEKEDLQRCLPSVLRVLVHETDEIPEDVIYAAKGRQGSGVWKEIQGTYYCHE